MPEFETIELMPDETMVTAEGRVGRVLRFDQIERAWRGTKKRAGWLTLEQYQIIGQIRSDLELLEAPSGMCLAGEFGMLADAARRSPQETVGEAYERIRDCGYAVGYKRAWKACSSFANGVSLRKIEQRLCLRNGQAKIGIGQSLERIAWAKIYEVRKYRTPTWAAMTEQAA